MNRNMAKKMSFESAIERLEEITSALEQGTASLSESLKLYEEGVKLSSYCEKELKKAEQKIIDLSDVKPEEETL